VARAAARRGRRGGWAEAIGSRALAEVLGLGLIALALLATLAIATYSPADPVFELSPVANRAGVVGATLAGALFAAFGYGAVVAVGAGAWLGCLLVLGRGLPSLASRFWLGALLLLLSLAGLPLLVEQMVPGTFEPAPTGWLGEALVAREVALLGQWGAVLVNGFLGIVGALFVAGIPAGVALAAVGAGAGLVGSWGLAALAALHAAGMEGLARTRSGVVGLGVALRRRTDALGEALGRRRAGRRPGRARRGSEETSRVLGELRSDEVSDEDAPLVEVEEAPSHEIELPPLAEDPPEPRAAGESSEADEAAAPRAGRRAAPGEEPAIIDHELERKSSQKPSQETFEFRDDAVADDYELPSLELFQRPPPESSHYDRDSLLMNSRILEKKLADFGVHGRVVRVHPGPVVTMYEYEPGPGIKVNKIVNLSDDLALAMRALGIRIIAPLPGKSVVGIEVPNPEREVVYFRELMESDHMRASSARIGVAMGKDIFGNGVTADLAKMPHLLVAGATGTGKSVFLNSVLCSILCRMRPDELKLLLVDPKLLELSIYEGIPHLIADVVTNPKRAAAALAGVVRMMEERYLMMSAVQVRNIDQFNAKAEEEIEAGNPTFRLKKLPGEDEGREIEWQRLPYVVVVIDELADLMVQVAREVEESLQRLAQMARAAGIHLILATQRPSVDVLTGVIKANFPSRVSFQVSSRIDSRTVLDQMGADQLLGQGDMLFLPPGTSRLQRLHGSYVTEKEVTSLVEYLREQGAPIFDEDLVRAAEASDAAEAAALADEEVDEMFDRAVEIVAETRNASISYVQRRLKIGYNRAARIVEMMENQGMIGPQEGTRPREVFLRKPDEDEV